jgi:hypothetical protein
LIIPTSFAPSPTPSDGDAVDGDADERRHAAAVLRSFDVLPGAVQRVDPHGYLAALSAAGRRRIRRR